MADGTIGIPVDGPGKKLDTEQLVVGVNTVQRERMQIAGANALEIARVLATDPAAADHGLVVRAAPPVSPQSDYVTSANLAAGASVDLDASTIAASTIGKLMRVGVGSSVACKWEVKTRDGAVLVVKHVIFTGGLTGKPYESWSPISKEAVTLAGAGVDENFRVTVTNLDDKLAADVHTTIEWDEV